jgi:hypothetical protein
MTPTFVENVGTALTTALSSLTPIILILLAAVLAVAAGIFIAKWGWPMLKRMLGR